MAKEEDSASSESYITDGRSEASSDTQSRGAGEGSMFPNDVAGKEYLRLSDSGSSSVLVSPDHICHSNKQIVESLKVKPIIIKRAKKTKVVRLFGVDIHVSTGFEYTIVHNPEPLRCFDPNMGQFVRPVPETEEPRAMDNFSRLLQSIEARSGVRPVFLYKKKLTKSDLSSNLNRLFITRSQELMGFLREEERRRVEDDDKNIWLDVLATDPAGDSHELHLKLWRSLNMVVLNGKKWNTVVSKNNLEAGHYVELWAYREQDADLRLVMNFMNGE